MLFSYNVKFNCKIKKKNISCEKKISTTYQQHLTCGHKYVKKAVSNRGTAFDLSVL